MLLYFRELHIMVQQVQPLTPYPPESILVGRVYAMRLRIHEDQSLVDSPSAFDWMIAIVNNPANNPMSYMDFMQVVTKHNRLGCRAPLIKGSNMDDQAISHFSEALNVIDKIVEGGGGKAFPNLSPLQTSPKFPVYIYRERPLTFEEYLLLANQTGRMSDEEGMVFLNSFIQPSQPIHLYTFPQSAIFQNIAGTSKPVDLNLFFPPHPDGSSKILQEMTNLNSGLPNSSESDSNNKSSNSSASPSTENTTSSHHFEDQNSQDNMKDKTQDETITFSSSEQQVTPNMNLEQGETIYHESSPASNQDNLNPPDVFYERAQGDTYQHEEEVEFSAGEKILKNASTEPFNVHNYLSLHQTEYGPDIENLVGEYELEELTEQMKRKGGIDPDWQKAIMLISKQNEELANKQASICNLNSQVEEQAKVVNTLSEFKNQFSSDLKSINGSLFNLVGRMDQMRGMSQALNNLRTEVSESSLTLSSFVDQVKKENQNSHDSMLAMFCQYQNGRDAQMLSSNPTTPSPSPHRPNNQNHQRTPTHSIHPKTNTNTPAPSQPKNPSRNDTNLTKVPIEGRGHEFSSPAMASQASIQVQHPQANHPNHTPTSNSNHLFTQRMGKVNQNVLPKTGAHPGTIQTKPTPPPQSQQYQPTMVYTQGQSSRQFSPAPRHNQVMTSASGSMDFKRPLPQSPLTPQGVRHPRKKLVFPVVTPPTIPSPSDTYQSGTQNYHSPVVPLPQSSSNLSQNNQSFQKSASPAPNSSPNFQARNVRTTHNPIPIPRTNHQIQRPQNPVRMMTSQPNLNYPPPNVHPHHAQATQNDDGTFNINVDYGY